MKKCNRNPALYFPPFGLMSGNGTLQQFVWPCTTANRDKAPGAGLELSVAIDKDREGQKRLRWLGKPFHIYQLWCLISYLEPVSSSLSYGAQAGKFSRKPVSNKCGVGYNLKELAGTSFTQLV